MQEMYCILKQHAIYRVEIVNEILYDLMKQSKVKPDGNDAQYVSR